MNKTNSIEKNFINKGFIISKIENKKNFNKIENKIYLEIVKFLKFKKKVKKKYLFDNIHKYVDKHELNNLRLKIYNKLNSDINFHKLYFNQLLK